MVSYSRADAPTAASPLSGFRPDATTVFQSKGALLALGGIRLRADAALNLTASQIADNRALAPPNSDGARLYNRSAETIAMLNGSVINSPLVREWNGSTLAPTADPALGDTWLQPHPNPPSAFYGASNMAEVGCMVLTHAGHIRHGSRCAAACRAPQQSSAAHRCKLVPRSGGPFATAVPPLHPP